MARRGPPGGRLPTVKVRGTRRRKSSSTRWLSRQLNDPYVAEARRLGYRSRAAFKLIELDQRFRLLRPGHRVVALAEDAFAAAAQILKPGGAFVAKVFQGGAEGALLAELKQDFAELRHVKPPASRAESAETYVVATGYRGGR